MPSLLRPLTELVTGEKPATRWLPGEHVVVIGTTGTGKTTLISKLVERRQYVVILRTKPDDVKFPGFKQVRTTKPMHDWRSEKLLIVPHYNEQSAVAHDLLEMVWKQRGWTLVIDEGFYAQNELNLRKPMEKLMTQGRSLGISVVTGLQRPAFVTRFLMSEATHVFTFRVEGRDLQTLRDMTMPGIVPLIQSMKRYHFVHYSLASRTKQGAVILRTGNARALDKILKYPGQVIDSARRASDDDG